MTPIIISRERPDTPEAMALITELQDELDIHGYPPESRHGYNVAKLIAQGVAFFVLREGGAPAACGGVQLFGAEYAELKRMYVRPPFRGRGHAKRILSHLAAYARAQGAALLRLETGIHQREAIALYTGWGFRPSGPFGTYRDDPLSVYMERALG